MSLSAIQTASLATETATRRPAPSKPRPGGTVPPPRRPPVGRPSTQRPPTGGGSGTTTPPTPRVEPEDLLRVERWLDRTTLPSRLPSKNESSRSATLKSVTVILAGDLELKGGTYAFARRETARNLVLIADRLTLSGETVFDLSGRALDVQGRVGMDNLDRSGGDLVVIARDLVVEDGGRIVLKSAGGRGYEKANIRDHRGGGRRPIDVGTNPRYGGGHGGDLIVSARRVEAGSAEADGFRIVGDGRRVAGVSAGSGFRIAGDLASTRPPAIERAFVLEAPPGGAGPGLASGENGRSLFFDDPARLVEELESRNLRRHGFGIGIPAVGRWIRQGTSEWLVASIDEALSRLRIANLGGTRREALLELSRAVALVRDGAPLHQDDRALHAELLGDLTVLSDRFEDGLIHDTMTVRSASGLSRRLDTFTAGRGLEARLAPTDALVRPRRADGREVLGLLALDPERSDRLHLELEAQLELDPWLRAMAADSLSSRGESVVGMFRDWQLEARSLVGEGIASSRIEVGPSGIVRVALELEAERASLVLARLASSAGLPLVFDWRSNADPDLRGTWAGPALTLSRRLAEPVRIEGGQLRSHAVHAVTVHYLELGDGRFQQVRPAITLAPGESVALPPEVGGETAIVPAAALDYPTDGFRPEAVFQTASSDGLVETLTVTNLLTHDLELGGLLYVEVELTHVRGQTETTVGPYRLAPAGAEGDSVDIALLALDKGEREVRVRGAAHYEGGSRESFAFDSADLVVKLTEEVLR